MGQNPNSCLRYTEIFEVRSNVGHLRKVTRQERTRISTRTLQINLVSNSLSKLQTQISRPITTLSVIWSPTNNRNTSPIPPSHYTSPNRSSSKASHSATKNNHALQVTKSPGNTNRRLRCRSKNSARHVACVINNKGLPGALRAPGSHLCIATVSGSPRPGWSSKRQPRFFSIMNSNSTIRRFCFTLNNYTEEDVEKIKNFIKSYCKYGIFGKELCPTTNTPHLQGFCNLNSVLRFSTIKKRINNRIHLEKAIGSDIQNQAYCSKAGDTFEQGTPCGQGRRSDIHALLADVVAGERNIQTLATNHASVYIRYFRGIERYLHTVFPILPRDHKTEVFYYWGPPGSGKSRRALEEARATNEDIYYKPRGLWWDGYKQQPNVIIDDYYGWLKYDELLKICDRYPYKVQVKGSFEEFTSKKIWFTSNIDTHSLYKFNGYENTAFERRITLKEHMN